MAAKKKAELVAEAEALGVDPTGMKVAELKIAVAAAAQATSPAAPASNGPNAAHAVGSDEGVHLQLGHLFEDKDGVMVFQLDSEFVLGREEALALAEEIPAATAAHHAVGAHSG